MAASSSPSLLERAQDFVSEHKRVVLIATAAAVVAAGGVAYYASTSRQPARRSDAEKGEKKDRKKGKKRASPKPSQGPILEERKSKAQEAERMSALAALTFFSRLTHSAVEVESLTAEEIASKSEKVSL
jgi:import receptor subunit TOM70